MKKFKDWLNDNDIFIVMFVVLGICFGAIYYTLTVQYEFNEACTSKGGQVFYEDKYSPVCGKFEKIEVNE